MGVGGEAQGGGRGGGVRGVLTDLEGTQHMNDDKDMRHDHHPDRSPQLWNIKRFKGYIAKAARQLDGMKMLHACLDCNSLRTHTLSLPSFLVNIRL